MVCPTSSAGSGGVCFSLDFPGCFCVKGLVDSSMCAISAIMSLTEGVREAVLSVSDDSLHVSLFEVLLLLLVFSLASSSNQSGRPRVLDRIVPWLEIFITVGPN